jgi:DNA-binding SARP family transcriptional activator/RecA/RadA recombinase
VQFRVLGPLEVVDGQRRVELGRPKQRALLAVLLVHANQVVPLDRLIEELWGEEQPAQAGASLQAYVSHLRRALEPGRPARTPPRVLVTQPPGYRLVVAPGDLDAARFVALAEEGHRLLEDGQPGPAAQVLREALGLWRGPALADVADEAFAQAERQRLEEHRLAALEDRLAAELAVGGHAGAAAELAELVGLHPFRERLHGLLMLALYRAGRQAEALRAFQAARDTLREELGIDPSPWLRQLEADILRQAPALDWTAPAPAQADPPPPVEMAQAATAAAAPVPPSPGEHELVGREAQLAAVGAAVRAGGAGRGRVVLVAGEPGIGKTRLAEEAARQAAAEGVRVTWGRCYEGEGAPAFWPWVQVVRQLLAEVPPGALGGLLERAGPELSQLLPELKEQAPAAAPPPMVELAAARFRLYQAVSGLLRRLSQDRPLLVVVDDLHWADAGSLGLLAFLATELRQARLTVLGTYRDIEVTAGQPLAETLGVLAREPVVERVTLGGLGKAEVASIIAAIIGTPAADPLVRAVQDRTDGNPFFVSELLRLLQSEGMFAGDKATAAARRAIPAGVREVLQRRLARLPEQTNAILLVGAIAGRGFDLDLVEAVAGLEDERALEAAEAAVVAGLVVEDDETVGRYRFAHGLVGETIYENISKARRVRLHARVGQALSGLHGNDPEHVLEIARHAWAAVPVTGADAALPRVLAAADLAMAGLAFEQAEQQLRRALELLGSMPPSAERSRRELGVQVRLGNLLSQLLSAGAPEARAAFGRAGELAAEVADDPAALPALAGVHRGLITQAELGRARALAERMLDGARRSEDPQALLASHYFLGQTMFLQGELVAAREHLEEAVRLAATMPDAAWLPGFPLDLGAAGFLEFALVLLGRAEDADRVAEAAGARLERAHPYSRGLVMGAALFAAVCRRDPALVQARAAAAAALAERWGFRMLAAAAMAPLGWVQAIQGDPAGGAARLREALAGWEAVGLRATQPLLLGLLAEAEQLAGRPEEALRRLEVALGEIDRSGEGYILAELHRLRGESLLALSPPRAAEAEAAFIASIDVARRQCAKLLEDRAAASLAQLRTARQAQSQR